MSLRYNQNIYRMIFAAITAALYVALTLGFAPLSYGSVQFRFSEILNLLAFFDPAYAVGVSLGCFISNFYSPLGIIDIVVGTTATVFATFMITKSKNLFIATLWPTVSCVLIGAELAFVYGIPFIMTTLSVMAGEFAVVTCAGYPIFKIIMANKNLTAILSFNKHVPSI